MPKIKPYAWLALSNLVKTYHKQYIINHGINSLAGNGMHMILVLTFETKIIIKMWSVLYKGGVINPFTCMPCGFNKT